MSLSATCALLCSLVRIKINRSQRDVCELWRLEVEPVSALYLYMS